MARQSEREGVWLARPLLDIPKSQLVATLSKAKIAFADDPTNRDTSFTRPRLRALMPKLAEEGGDVRNLARLASRLARANAALEVLVDGAERYLALSDRNDAARFGFDAQAFAALPEEIRLRLLMRAIDRTGHEGPAELGKAEALLAALDRAAAEGEGRLKQTLAGAVISLSGGRIHVAGAPPRRAGKR
jgi:tRNA(Ile)-lysidine synthase